MSERLTNSLTQDGKRAVPLSNRNVVINGAMQVAQRGTSTASITTSAYNTADRFFNDISGLGTWTQTVENDAPTGSGFRKSLKMLCTTADASPAAADYNFISQLFEGQNLQQFAKGTASAKPFSLSFWVKSNVTGTYIAELFDADNTRQVSASYTISVSATWEKKTITFPADTTGALDNDNALSLILNFGLGAGSDRTSGTLNTVWAANTTANRYVGQTNLAAATSNYWQVTGIQLEVGSVATPFEFEDIGTTLAKCQRYFTNHALASYGFSGFADTTTSFLAVGQFVVEMRTAPTNSPAATAADFEVRRAGVASSAVTAIASTNATATGVRITATTGATLTAGAGGILASSSGTKYLYWSAEL